MSPMEKVFSTVRRWSWALHFKKKMMIRAMDFGGLRDFQTHPYFFAPQFHGLSSVILSYV
jgi:hypothetical protein